MPAMRAMEMMMSTITNDRIANLSFDRVEGMILSSGHIATDRALSSTGPLEMGRHLAETGGVMVIQAVELTTAQLLRLRVDVPEWGMTPDEISEAGAARLAEAQREKRRALAMVDLATYP